MKRLGRADLLIAGVDSSGLVAGIEHANKQDAVTLFKIQESNHSNFPQVNWASPVWHVDREAADVEEWLACPVQDVRRRIGLLRLACASASASTGQDRVLSRMQAFCRELAPRFLADGEGELTAFPLLIERLLSTTAPADEWLRSLTAAALCSAETGSGEMLTAVETLLVGKFDKKANKFHEAKVAILFDLADCTKFRCRVASPRMGGYFSRRLIATATAGTGTGRCGLAGVDMELETDKMPSPRLPVLGDTVLMSMNPDTPCQTRKLLPI
ncbi:MAG: hypothetical protein M1541_09960 [Acidobacteria bacterium]|nr:hypothetical protein [Acidobacteriota bacterium]